MNENGFNNTRATIKDVAVKANVSLSTVSRALREPDKRPRKRSARSGRLRKRSITSTTRRRVPSSKGARTPSASSCLPRRMRRSA
ncbi:MAG: LacI family DNA-binding transcriptional regulator [Bilophila wadsworthia]